MINVNTGYSDKADWSLVPGYMREGMERYLSWGIPMGDFGTALVEGDFFEMCRRADDKNLSNLSNYARFFYNYVNPDAFGSPEKVAEWVKDGGAHGRNPI